MFGIISLLESLQSNTAGVVVSMIMKDSVVSMSSAKDGIAGYKTTWKLAQHLKAPVKLVKW